MRHRLGILVIALGTAAPVALAQVYGTTQHRDVDVQTMSRLQDANSRLKPAWSLLEKKDLAGARKQAEETLALVPILPEGHVLLARIAYVEKDFLKALAEVEAAKSGHEKIADLRERMHRDLRADLRKRMQLLDEDIANMRGRLASASSSAQPSIETSIAHAESDKAHLNQLENEPTGWSAEIPAEYDFLHGNIQMRLGSYVGAVAQYDEALRKKPAYAEAANNLASLHFDGRQYAKALEVVQKAEAAGARLNPELTKAIEQALAP